MAPQPDIDRVMALAGVYQSISLVQQVARTGSMDDDPFAATIQSLFQIDSESTEAVFGGWRNLRRGLTTLCTQLNRENRDVELTRYAVCLLFLERKLVRRNDLMQIIAQGVEGATTQVEYFSTTHSCVVANLADIYLKTVSTLSPRIMVTGTPQHLNNPENANRIRALLLAGLRSTVLWRQLGGSRLQLLLFRTRILASAEKALAELEA